MVRKIIVFLLLLLINVLLYANPLDSNFKIKFFSDAYYTFDFNNPSSNTREFFLYNHNRHNEFNINLALLRFQYNDGKTKANLGLQAGTYAIDNYADEKSLWKNIYEANIGVAIDKKEKLWLEAGILPSHIGLETAISSECLTLSRSLSSENSPFFLTGVQLNYQINKNWNVKGLLCNGWQRIEKVQGNSIPSIGG